MSKRLLFIGPKFYNYHNEIKKGFEDKGYIVDYYSDRPGDGLITKSLIRLNKKLLTATCNSYMTRIIKDTKMNHYDVVFVLYGQCFSRKMIKRLKEAHKEARFIFYMYDPIASMPDRLDFSKEFDKFATFELSDSKKYGIPLIPLFYTPEDMPKEDLVFDACFIGTMMPGKYKLVNEILNEFKKNNRSVLNYSYIQSKKVLKYYKLKTKEFRGANPSSFKFERLGKEDCNKYIMQSNIVIDCPKENQTGLTIRTFECLFAHKKMITTNKTIKEYDFYNPNNIYVYDGKIDWENPFFKNPYEEISNIILQEYSISKWCEKILA